VAHRPGTAFEVDVLTGQRLMEGEVARRFLQVAHPERDRLTSHEDDRAVSGERLQKTKDPLHLLVAQRRLGHHQLKLAERARGS
jgi:hypothetical protein